MNAIGRHWKCVVAALVVANVVITEKAAFAGQLPDEFIKIRQARCAPLQADFDHYLAAAKHTPASDNMRRRIRWMDESAVAVLRAMVAHRNAYLAQSLAVIGNDKKNDDSDAESSPPVTAVEIFRTQKAKFPDLDVSTDLTEANKRTLESYWQAYCQGTEDAVCAYGKSIVAKDSAANSEIARLSVVPLFLTMHQVDFRQIVANMPGWLRIPPQSAALQDFALHVEQPELAYRLTRNIPDQAISAGESDPYTNFLRGGADQMLRTHDYEAGIGLLRTVMDRCEFAHNTSKWEETGLYLGEVTNDADRTKESLAVVDRLIQASPGGKLYPREVLLRLKCQYKLRQYDQILKDATGYSDDARCEAVQADVLYIGWVASRQLGSLGEQQEGEWRGKFLEKFPNHPLGANMYFATAMRSVSANDYKNASLILAFIENHYPSSEIMTKAQEIKRRIETASEGAGAN